MAEIRSARSSLPPSMAISESQIRSTSPSRCEQTTTEMPNSVPMRWIRLEHRVPAGRVEAVGRLVEQQQVGVVHERLGQLDPLLHAGGVAADLAVALLVETRRGAAPRRPARGRRCAGRPAHPGHVGHELGGGQVGRQAVVLGHVADPGADLGGLAWSGPARAPAPGRRSAASSPSRILIRVDLPAPLAPTSPMMPGSTSTVRSASATTPLA